MYKNFFSQTYRCWFVIDCDDDTLPVLAMCPHESNVIKITGALNTMESQSASHNNRSLPCGYHKYRDHCNVISDIHRHCGIKPCMVSRQAVR